MVVEAALGATFRVAPRPYAHVHGKDGMFILASGQRKAGEQAPQGLGIDSPPVQRGVEEAAPAATMRGLEAQVNGGRYGVGGEDGIGEFEEGIGSAVKTLVERAAEAVESVVRFHDALIMHSPPACRLIYQPMELKRKLRAKYGDGAVTPHVLIHRITES
jgi:hypothetical protein